MRCARSMTTALFVCCHALLVHFPIAVAVEPLPQPPLLEGSDLPEIDQEDAEVQQQDEVSLAGGAIRFAVPQGWHVSEVPTGREMRVWVTPEPLVEGRSGSDGIWITFHWRGRAPDDGELRAWLSGRIKGLLAQRSQDQRLRTAEIAGYAGLALSSANQRAKVEHFVVGLETGIFELAVSAPPSKFASRRQVAAQLLERLQLQVPRLPLPDADRRIATAANAIGLWKSLRGQLRLGDDQRVELRFDGRHGYPLDETGVLRYGQPARSIQGSYQAEDDMLLVAWDDGSRTNYRWAVEDGQLLLTDHHGRVSQLNRLLE
ncbi:MAG: hypothetical protein OES79_12915 [Planctomycetota bacterium]|nr:hypothetical protein [Planctomycetota bacterium]